MNKTGFSRIRLSDRILFSLQLALEQEDLRIAELLKTALELSITRQISADFVERRDYPPELDKAMQQYYELRKKNGVDDD